MTRNGRMIFDHATVELHVVKSSSRPDMSGRNRRRDGSRRNIKIECSARNGEPDMSGGRVVYDSQGWLLADTRVPEKRCQPFIYDSSGTLERWNVSTTTAIRYKGIVGHPPFYPP